MASLIINTLLDDNQPVLTLTEQEAQFQDLMSDKNLDADKKAMLESEHNHEDFQQDFEDEIQDG